MIADTFKEYLQACEFKNEWAMLDCFEELSKEYTFAVEEKNLLQECSDLVDDIIEEKRRDGKPAKTSRSEVQERLMCARDTYVGEDLESYGIEIDDRRKLAARVINECFFGNYVRLLETMEQPGVPDKSTADLAEDERDLNDLMGIVGQFLKDHKAYPDVLDGASKCVEDLNESIEWLLYQKNKHMVSTDEKKQKSFDTIQELFNWVGIDSNENENLFNLPPHAHDMLFEIERRLASFPMARQCFQSFRSTGCDFGKVIKFVKDFPEFVDTIYGPAKWTSIQGTTFMWELVKKSSKKEHADQSCETVEGLLNNGANVNLKLGKHEYSLLHHAFVSRSSERLVKLLLRYDADTEQRDKFGRRPYEMVPMNDNLGIQTNIKNIIKDHSKARSSDTLVWEKAEIMKERSAKMRKGEEMHWQWDPIPVDSTLSADLNKMYKLESTEMRVVGITKTRFDLGSWRKHEGTDDDSLLRLQRLPDYKGKVIWEKLENKQLAEWSPLEDELLEHKLEQIRGRRMKAGDIDVEGHGKLVPTDAGYDVKKPRISVNDGKSIPSFVTIAFIRWRPSWCFAQTVREPVQYEYECDIDEAPKPTTDTVDDSDGSNVFETGGTPMQVHQGEPVEFGYENDIDEAPKPIRLDIGGTPTPVPEDKDGLADLLEEIKIQKRDAEKGHEKNKERQQKIQEKLDRKRKEFEELKRSAEEIAKKVKMAESDEKLRKALEEKQEILAKLGTDMEKLKVSEELINSRVKKSERELDNANQKLKETLQILKQQKDKAEKMKQEIAEKKKAIENKARELDALRKLDEKERAAIGKLGEEHQRAWEALKGLRDAEAARLAREKSMITEVITVPKDATNLGIVNVIADRTLLEQLLKQAPDYRDLMMLLLNEQLLSATVPNTSIGGLNRLNRAWWTLARYAEKHNASIDAVRAASLKMHMNWLWTNVLTRDYRHMSMAKAFKDHFEKRISDWLEYHTNKYKEGSNARFQRESRTLVDSLGSRTSNDWDRFCNELKNHKTHNFDAKIKTLEHGFAKNILTGAAQQQLKSMRDELSTKVKEEVEAAAKKQGLDEREKDNLWESLQTRFQSNQQAFNENCKRLKDELKEKKDDAWVLQSFLLKFSVHFSLANDTLPIYAQSPNMIRSLKEEDTDVLVVECDTGSGKSTVLAALLMAEFDHGKTCVTQPRILPCKRTCEFVNSKLGGELVGWESADNSSNPEAKLVYVTDGLISARALGPGLLKSNYSIIAFDEVHERSKSIDTGLIGTALQVSDAKKKGRPRPKIVIMSATLDTSCLIPFKKLGLKVSQESVKVKSPFTTTVDDKYRGKHFLTATTETYFNRKRIDEQILCFLPGTAEVNDAAAAFFDQTGVRAAVLSGQEDPKKMQEVLETATVFFSTNIAETSITVPCLAYVVDCGKKKTPSHRDSVFRLSDEPAPRSTCLQRMGRCGRVRDGTYIPLYKDELEDEAKDSKARAAFAKPEIVTFEVLAIEFPFVCAHIADAIPKWALKGADGEPMLKRLRHILPLTDEIKKKDGLLDSRIMELSHVMAELTMVDKSCKLNQVGERMAWLPEIGGVGWRRALVKGVEIGIGESVLMLCAAWMALPNVKKWIWKGLIPPHLKKEEDGDLCSLFNFFCEAWRAEQQDQSVKKTKRIGQIGEHLKRFVATSSKSSGKPHDSQRIIVKMLKGYDKLKRNLVRLFNQATENEKKEFFHGALASRVAKPDEILQAVLYGFIDRVAIYGDKVGGRINHYTLLFKSSEEGKGHCKQHIATIDFSSTLSRKSHEDHAEYVFAVELGHPGISDDAPEVLGAVNRCEEKWILDAKLPTCSTYTEIHADEKAKVDSAFARLCLSHSPVPGVKFFNSEAFPSDMLLYRLTDKPGKVALALKYLAEELNVDCKVGLFPPKSMNDKYDVATYERNIQEYQAHMHRIFKQWRQNWKNLWHVEIMIYKDKPPADIIVPEPLKDKRRELVPHFNWTGRTHQNKKIKEAISESNSSVGAVLATCSVAKAAAEEVADMKIAKEIEENLKVGVDFHLKALQILPLRIKDEGPEFDDIRGRIRQCCDLNRTQACRWSHVVGSQATRASRMAVVTWVATTKYDMVLKGGFIRDWVIRGDEFPALDKNGEPDLTITKNKFMGRPEIPSGYIPQDLDCTLHSPHWLDPYQFKTDVEREGIEVTRIHIDHLIMIFLFDASPGKDSKGPFLMEITLPHIKPTNVDIDFDINNLCITRDNPEHLSMRIPHPSLTVPGILRRILNKEFQCCKSTSGKMPARVQKMIDRGWVMIHPFLKEWVPGAEGPVRVLISSGDAYYEKIKTELLLARPGTKILKIWRIQNDALERAFWAARERIRDQEKNPDKVEEGWHGTSNTPEASEGIASQGFDKRFYSDGDFGYGVYVSAKAKKANYFAKMGIIGLPTNVRLMFYVKVLRGAFQKVQGDPKKEAVSPLGCRGRKATDPGFNSVLGLDNRPESVRDNDEWVFYRPEQVLPLYQIEYV